MTNWCDNILRLEHSNKSKLEEALQAFNKEKSLNYFAPEPVHDDQPDGPIYRIRPYDLVLREAHKRTAGGRLPAVFLHDCAGHGEDDNFMLPRWYAWRIKNWGTRSDIAVGRYKWISDHCLELYFDTACEPPLSAYDAAVAIHGFKLVAFYYEFGSDFGGEYIPNEKNVYFDYGDEFPTNLDEMFDIKEREQQSGQAEREWEQEERENEKTAGLKLQ